MSKTPKKYKGCSKLPEAVQQKMDPKAAMRYMKGGAVSTERNGVLQEHYVQPQEAPMKLENSGFSRGGGAAISGTKFTGVK